MTSQKPDYKTYAGDIDHEAEYKKCQSRYVDSIRESDKVLISLVHRVLSDVPAAGARSLADFGCSTGNLLLHLRRAFPEVELHGIDLMQKTIKDNRANPLLKGIDFHQSDALTEEPARTFYIVTANALAFALNPQELKLLVGNLAKALKPGVTAIFFDLFHPFKQELEIKETSAAFPNGLMLYVRSYDTVRSVFESAGFPELEFLPFSIPIDLARPEDRGIQFYTVATAANERISYRGCLSQPWCHLVARRAN